MDGPFAPPAPADGMVARASDAQHGAALRDVERASRYFRFREFAVSASHPELVVPVPEGLRPTVRRLATELDKVREHAGVAILVLSGLRSLALNKAVGGSPTSQHTVGEASDITVLNRDATRFVVRLAEWLLEEARSGRFTLGQVIVYPKRGFLHVALPSRRFPHLTVCVHEGPYQYEPASSLGEYRAMMAKLGHLPLLAA